VRLGFSFALSAAGVRLRLREILLATVFNIAYYFAPSQSNPLILKGVTMQAITFNTLFLGLAGHVLH
jgi:hypothetical protein